MKKELTPLARKSCVVISKVLQNLFNLRIFKEDSKPDTLSMMRLNPFLEEYFPKVFNLHLNHPAFFEALFDTLFDTFFSLRSRTTLMLSSRLMTLRITSK